MLHVLLKTDTLRSQRLQLQYNIKHFLTTVSKDKKKFEQVDNAVNRMI